MIKNILTIAGSDSGGGAGVQADLKTIGALGGYGLGVITAVTAQNTRGVAAVHEIPASIVVAQLNAIFDDIRIDAVKIGMVGSADIIGVIVEALKKYTPKHVVLDPVMVSTSGDRLADEVTIDALRDDLTPLASVLTPNIPEAEIFLGCGYTGDMSAFAADLLMLGADGVLLKGGHDTGANSNDLYSDRSGSYLLESLRIDTRNTHGTGCTLSSAMAVFLAQGMAADKAARAAKDYVRRAIIGAQSLNVGQGAGPLHHFCDYQGHDE